MLLNLQDVEIGERMRHLAERNIFTVAMNEEDLSDHLLGNSFPSHKEAVVGDMDTMELSAVLAQVHIVLGTS